MNNITNFRDKFNKDLIQLFSGFQISSPYLKDAMIYGVLGDGSRIRPYILTSIAEIFGISYETSKLSAMAVEFVHCFSLIHDDLPALDDDDMRRNKPSVHIKFDEATAILAGDALLNRAFGLIINDNSLTDSIKLSLISSLSEALGDEGMIDGQALDLKYSKTNLQEVLFIHEKKTAMIFKSVAKMGIILARENDLFSKEASNKKYALKAMAGYGFYLGMLYQAVDDFGDFSVTDDKEKYINIVAIKGREWVNNYANALADKALEQISKLAKINVEVDLSTLITIVRNVLKKI